MLVTIDWIRKNYNKFNRRYWGSKLPDIEFFISRSKNNWGFAGFDYVYEFGKLKTIKPTKIIISNYYDSPEKVKQTTLLHEMIHIADYTFHPEHFVRDGKYVSGHKYNAHGVWFKDEAYRLSKYGWNIDKYVSGEERKVSTRAKKENVKAKVKREASKIDNALICCVNGTKGNWWFKTDKNKIYSILNTIQKIDWNTIGEVTMVKFYSFDNKNLAKRRSCNTRIYGWKVNDNKLQAVLDKYKAVKYREFKFVA